MTWKRINWPVLVASLVLLGGFFVPWLQIGDGESARVIAGYSIGSLAAVHGSGYYAAFLLPLLAVGMGVAAVKKPNVASWIAIATGASLLAWGLFEIARFLYLQTFFGLWIMVAGAMLAAFGGALTWRRAHVLVAQAKAAAKAAKAAGDEAPKSSSAVSKPA
jgi:hypothetical protein